jgi:hypothetical protein
MRLRTIFVVLLCLLVERDPSFAQWTNIGKEVVSHFYNAGGALSYRDGVLWAGSHTLYRSLDSGKHWKLIGANMTNYNDVSWLNMFDRNNVVTDASSSAELSTDGGLNWQQSITPGYTIFGNTADTLFSIHAESFWVKLHDGTYVRGSFTSEKRGQSWSLFSASDGTLYVSVSADTGLMVVHSTDRGMTWIETSGKLPRDTYNIAVDSNDSKVLYAVTPNLGLTSKDPHSYFSISTDAGESWQQTQYPIQYFMGALATSKYFIYAESTRSGILRSSDRGTTWTPIGNNFSAQEYSNEIAVTGDSTVFFLDHNGNVWMSTNAGGNLRADVSSLTDKMEGHCTYFFYDLTGRLVRQIERDVHAGMSEIGLNASSLVPGCYWYTVRGDGWTKSGKVMKLP